jgi:molybdenum cofactor cytidylyltransferase
MTFYIKYNIEINSTILRPDSIIFMVCDQPYVSSSLLLSLIEKKQVTGMPIVASSYEEKLGTPAIFHRSFFPALLELKGDIGARKIIIDNPEKVTTILFPKGQIDIDTNKDYEILNKENDN